MTSLLKLPMAVMKSRRIPNAFMLFVKEEKQQLMEKCPEESKAVIGAYLGKKWRSLTMEEKQVYFDKYQALKKSEKMQTDTIDIKPIMTKDIMDVAEDGIIHETPIDPTSNVTAVESDQGTGKDKNKRKSDECFPIENETSHSKKKTDDSMASASSVSSSIEDSPSVMSFKAKSKKIRRPPNAFMLFAKEQRYSLDPSVIKDTRSHASTILGNMWKSLPDSEKDKYYIEANRLFNLYKKRDTAASSSGKKTGKKKSKVHPKKPCKKSAGRPIKKTKDTSSSAPAPGYVNNHADKDSDKKSQTETESKSPSTQEENNESANIPFQPSQVSLEYPTANYMHPLSSLVTSQFHRVPPAIEPHHHSKYCLCRRASPGLEYNNDANVRQHLLPDAGLSRSFFGSGSSPSFFPSYPFNPAAFWMYQQAMAHYMYSFPPPNFSQSYCGCSTPYPTYPNTYFSSYFAGRCSAPFPNAPQPSSLSSADTSAFTRVESVDAAKNEDNSNDELVIVDEEAEGGQKTDNGTRQHQ